MTLLTAIMPTTKYRLDLVPLAIERFIAQKTIIPRDQMELVIISEDEEVLDLAETYWKAISPARLTLRMCPRGLFVGAKRNWACKWAHGDWILFWDDDDWCSDNRIDETAKLFNDDVDLVGSRSMLIHEILDERRRTFVFEYPAASFDEQGYFVGGLLAFRRPLWAANPFPAEKFSGEDGWWVLGRLKEGARFAELTHPELYVAMRHTTNTGNTQTPSGDPWWRPYEGDLAATMEGALPRYEQAFKAMVKTVAALPPFEIPTKALPLPQQLADDTYRALDGSIEIIKRANQ